MRRLGILAFALAILYGQEPSEEKPKLEPLKTSITVTEKIDAEVPGVVSTLDNVDIASRPGVNLDDRLRDVPGFSLFRRSSSLVAHPTTQGISLRGLGSSGASRTLVLLDGFPVNDPFGGWVYWSRFNPDALDRIEISRSAASSVYGDRAMGGAISVLTQAPEGRRFTGAVEAGNAGIVDAHAGYSESFGRFGASVFGRAFTTEGYFIVPGGVRGPVDTRAGVDYVVGDLKLDYFGRADHVSLKSNLLAEERDNGTPIQQNSSSLGTVGLQYSREQFSVRAYHSRGEFHSGFSTVAANRASERATFRQTVPSQDWGGAALWRHASAPWNLVLGADLHRARGESRDTFFPTGIRVGGGHLWQQGTFVQSDLAVGRRARIFGGLRHDFTGRGNTFWSPSAGVVVADGPRRWRASAYRSFRAPTLNELFRAFSVGNTLTLANPGLRPETLVGGEAGMDWQVRSAVLRSSLFWNSIDDLVGNVTLSATPSLITRQRQNLISARTRGAELELEKAFRHIRASAAYMFVDGRVGSGLRIPQVGRHQGSAQVLYQSGKTLASVGIRSYSLQLEDDLNRFVLPGYATVQLMVRQRLARGFSASVAVENLLDHTYLTGFSPTPTIAAPRLWRAGLRWESGR